MTHHLGCLVIELAINVVCLGIDHLISRNKKSNHKSKPDEPDLEKSKCSVCGKNLKSKLKYRKLACGHTCHKSCYQSGFKACNFCQDNQKDLHLN